MNTKLGADCALQFLPVVRALGGAPRS